MRVKFLHGCQDKYTKAIYPAGYVLECTEERGAEICATPYAVALDPPKTAKKQPAKKKASPKK